MRVLIIEDEDRMCHLLRDGLREHGHTAVAAADGIEGLALASECSFDVILLDLMLPGVDGWEVMRRLRESACPASVIMLTACDAEIDVIRGFDAGADDYLTKPFSFAELLARITNLQRARLTSRNEMLTMDTLAVDSSRHLAFRSGRILSLTRTEFAVLHRLFKSAGQAVSRSEIICSVWGQKHKISRGNLDSFVSLLRKKIDPPYERRLVHTVKGMGYMLGLPDTLPPRARRTVAP